ncbi:MULTISPECIES: N-acetylneuraminate synthase family protein [Thalassospira]|uniref:N-acetylneuraminate synthase n=2 Tax=Thalassospira TaxID=168934 RepID=A0A367WEH0_9PROT|nr:MULTISPECIES: N-acetylneuraminate synthase family protein [Thalassospira]MDG4717671.1 N-acetylneuraminate synthase family protein [Thalassospira sp. FZY0004]RCK38870.1 N-acetylneuraminate synthase [Thalassospira profundimaris]
MIKIGSRSIGAESPCFITFEAGPTHEGLNSAKELVLAASQSGGDAVKFQMIDPDRLVADRKMLFSYDVLVDRNTGRTETVSEPLYDILARRALSFDEYKEIKRYADTLGISVFATVFFEEEVEFAARIGFDSLKIASADVNHLPLLRQAAKTGLCLQLDTGNATIGEVEQAIDVIRAVGNENIIIHHCPSGYPARIEGINLRVIHTLGQMFSYPIAFSDHTPGWDMDIAALTLGAKLLEKTISADRTTRSVEHIMSLEPAEMSAFVKAVREVEGALGNPRRLMSPLEKEKRLGVRRSVFAAKDILEGDVLDEGSVEYRRPGNGIAPDLFESLGQAKARRDIAKGTKLSVGDLDWKG